MEVKEYEIKAEMNKLEEVFKDYPVVLNTRQVAEIIGVDECTVSRYTYSGLPSYKSSKKKKAPFSFLKMDVLRYKAEHRSDFTRR